MRKAANFFIGGLVDYLSRFIFRTCHVEIEDGHHLASQATKGSCMLVFWHDCLFGILPILVRIGQGLRYSAFVSASRDGLLVQKVCKRYRECEVIAVSHDKRHQALRVMIQQLEQQKKVILLTPDGPRGPAHVVKPGLFFAAYKTKAPIIALSWSASSCWTLRSWDKMRIPKPFSTIRVKLSAPLVLEKMEDEGIVAQLLASVTEDAEAGKAD